MSYRLTDIRHETRDFFVLSVGDKGFEVYKTGCGAAVKVASIGNGPAPDLGIERAIRECKRRQAIADFQHDKAAKATGN